MNDESEKSQEIRLRKLAKQLGYELEKDRPEGRDMEHQGGYSDSKRCGPEAWFEFGVWQSAPNAVLNNIPPTLTARPLHCV